MLLLIKFADSERDSFCVEPFLCLEPFRSISAGSKKVSLLLLLLQVVCKTAWLLRSVSRLSSVLSLSSPFPSEARKCLRRSAARCCCSSCSCEEQFPATGTQRVARRLAIKVQLQQVQLAIQVQLPLLHPPDAAACRGLTDHKASKPLLRAPSPKSSSLTVCPCRT